VRPHRMEGDFHLPALHEPGTNQARIWSGEAFMSVQRSAWVGKWPCGSRMSIQRMGTGGRPVEYQTAVSVTLATARSPQPYQCATVSAVQCVDVSA
jgi:hypothetical protein